MNGSVFSWARLWAVARKELIQMRRDRLTFAMMIGVPLIQLVLFGFAINSDPKRLPTAVVWAEASTFTRSFTAALQNSQYFEIVATPASVAEAGRMLELGQVQFVLHVPAGFSRALVRGERPALLLEADASDPAATGNALATLQQLANDALQHDLQGALAPLQARPPPYEIRVHRRYNPEGIT
ncbi:MAG: ABC transporter permease, partial [Nevskiales bacterium]